MEEIYQFVKPELLVLAPVLMIIGAWLKKSSIIKDKNIPAALGICGILLSGIYVLSFQSFESFQQFLQGFFTAVTQGILSAGLSVYTHQLLKQRKKPCTEEKTPQNTL